MLFNAGATATTRSAGAFPLLMMTSVQVRHVQTGRPTGRAGVPMARQPWHSSSCEGLSIQCKPPSQPWEPLAPTKAAPENNQHQPPRLKMVQQGRPRSFLHENVTQFPTATIGKILPDYIMVTFVISPHSFGFPVSRTRRYALLVPKDRGPFDTRAINLLQLWSLVSPDDLTHQDIFCATNPVPEPMTAGKQRAVQKYKDNCPNASIYDISQDAVRRPSNQLLCCVSCVVWVSGLARWTHLNFKHPPGPVSNARVASSSA